MRRVGRRRVKLSTRPRSHRGTPTGVRLRCRRLTAELLTTALLDYCEPLPDCDIHAVCQLIWRRLGLGFPDRTAAAMLARYCNLLRPDGDVHAIRQIVRRRLGLAAGVACDRAHPRRCMRRNHESQLRLHFHAESEGLSRRLEELADRREPRSLLFDIERWISQSQSPDPFRDCTRLENQRYFAESAALSSGMIRLFTAPF